MKMGKLGEEVSEKIKCAIRAKLTELGVHIDNELPDYVMVLVANKKTQKQMDEDLSLFLGDSTSTFTSWLYDVLKKLEQVTISKGMKRKIEEKKAKHKKSSPTESETLSFNKKVKLKSEDSSPRKLIENYSDNEEMSNSNDVFDSLSGKEIEKIEEQPQQPNLISYTEDEERMIIGEDDDAINLHDNNEGDYISDRPASSLKESSVVADENNLLNQRNKSSSEEIVKPRERITISWDNSDNSESTRKTNVNKEEFTSTNRNKSSKKDEEWEQNKKRNLHENNTKNSLKENEIRTNENRNIEIRTNVREKNDFSVNKIIDARDILKKKSSLTAKVTKNESKREKHRHSRRKSRDKGSKENHTRSAVTKPSVREPEKPTVPSLVKVTPRPVRPSGMQPSCNLILKAVADAEKSIATSKLTQKKQQNKNEYKDKMNKRSRRENISITLLNDRVVSSSDIVDTSEKKEDFIEECEVTYASPIDEPKSPLFTSEVIDNKDEQPSSTTSNGYQHLSSNEDSNATLSEPRFIITLDNTASDTEVEGELDSSIVNENCNINNEEETVTVVRQPFDRSRLGPRLGPPFTEEHGSREYRLFTIVEGNDSSQDVEMETSEQTPDDIKSQTRCKYWPCCDAGSACSYHHPTTLCRLFPACHYGDKCLYIHPACKFADKCLNVNCPFAHTSATPVVGKGSFKAPLPLSTPNGQICIYYPNCKKPFCPYIHIKKPCKFGSSCNKLGCEFEHPNRSVTKNPYKWVANQ